MLLKHLLLFHRLQPYTSFREAASALQIPESTLRKTIHQLETELECTLLMTDQRGFQWTPIARRLFPHTDALRNKTRTLYRLSDLLNEEFSHCIALASGSHYGSLILTDIMGEILEDYPAAQFSLVTLDNQTLLQQLVADKIDFSILRIHDIEAPTLNSALRSLPLEVTTLYKDRMCFLVGPHHSLYEKHSATLQDIMQTTKLLSKDPADKLTKTFFQKNGYEGTILQISNVLSLRHFISMTNYASWQSVSAAENSLQRYNDDLHILEIEDFAWSCTTYAVCSKTPTFGERILFERLSTYFGLYDK